MSFFLSISEFQCHIAGCKQLFDTVEGYEHHYNSLHRHVCSSCKRSFPSNRLLDIHILEWHDSLFQVMAERECMVMSIAEMSMIIMKYKHYICMKCKHYICIYRYKFLSLFCYVICLHSQIPSIELMPTAFTNSWVIKAMLETLLCESYGTSWTKQHLSEQQLMTIKLVVN